MMKRTIFGLIFTTIPFLVSAQHFGRPNHPMNKRTGNIEVLQYWNNNSPETVEMYRAALEVLSSGKDANYKDLLADEKYLELRKKYELHLLGGPILGNISDSGVSIWLRTGKRSKVQIALSSGNESFVSDAIYTGVEDDLTAVFNIKGLADATNYSYKVILNDTLEISDDNYSFQTLPAKEKPDSLRIAFGSCFHRWGLGNDQLFSTIKERDPLAMLLLGDIAVQDRNNNLGMHRADYLLRDFQSAWNDFACRVPVYASLDDHDYFDNDRAGIPKGYSDKDRRHVREIFKNSWCNPSYGQDDEGIYFSTQIGPFDVVMTDNRYFRTGEDGSFLGDAQMEWLKKQIIECESPFLILSSGTMWNDFVSNGKDSWGVNDTEGREEIFHLLEEQNLSGVLLISGDRHGGVSLKGTLVKRFMSLELPAWARGLVHPKRNPNGPASYMDLPVCLRLVSLHFITPRGKKVSFFG